MDRRGGPLRPQPRPGGLALRAVGGGRRAKLIYRVGCQADLPETFELYLRALNDTAILQGVVPPDDEPTDDVIESGFERHRDLLEFLASRRVSRYWLCEDRSRELFRERSRVVGYGRVVGLGGIEELTELMIEREHRGRGIGTELLKRCWPRPEAEAPRLVIAVGAPADLSLYSRFGVLPVAGHWDLRVPTPRYLERRGAESREVEPDVKGVEAAVAGEAWRRLETAALGHARPELHEHFARTRRCLSLTDGDGRLMAVCWLGREGDVGPAAGATQADLAAVVVGALDEVARSGACEELAVFVTTTNAMLYPRLMRLGFRVYWPSWILASQQLPRLDLYLPTFPPYVL